MLDLTEVLKDCKPLATVRLFTLPVEIFKVSKTKSNDNLIISDAINENVDKILINDGDINFVVDVIKITSTGAIVSNSKNLTTLTKNARLGVPRVYEAYPDDFLPEKFYQKLISSTINVCQFLPQDIQDRYMSGEAISQQELASRLTSKVDINKIIEMMTSSPQRQTVEARFQMPDGLMKHFPVSFTETLNDLLLNYNKDDTPPEGEGEPADPKE